MVTGMKINLLEYRSLPQHPYGSDRIKTEEANHICWVCGEKFEVGYTIGRVINGTAHLFHICSKECLQRETMKISDGKEEWAEWR